MLCYTPIARQFHTVTIMRFMNLDCAQVYDVHAPAGGYRYETTLRHLKSGHDVSFDLALPNMEILDESRQR